MGGHAARIADLIRNGEIQRFQYITENGRIVPVRTQEIFDQLNRQLSNELNPGGDLIEFLRLTPINGQTFR